jgi:hypothetical protein
MKIIFYGIVFLFCFSFVSAVGVTTLNSEVRPFILAPGESVKTHVIVTNKLANAEDVNVEAEIIGEPIIAEFVDDKFTVKAGEEVKLEIKVNAPDDSKIGDEFKIKMLFKIFSSEDQEKGNVNFITGLGAVIPVTIGTPSNSPSAGSIGRGVIWFWVIVLVFVVGIVIVAFGIALTVKKRKKSSVDYSPFRNGVLGR